MSDEQISVGRAWLEAIREYIAACECRNEESVRSMLRDWPDLPEPHVQRGKPLLPKARLQEGVSDAIRKRTPT